MGMQNSDPTVIHSSIALLQERFRQLHRVKQMREERELLKLFSKTERIMPTIRSYEQSRVFSQPEPSLQCSLSLRPEPQGKYGDYQAFDTPLLMSLWPTDRGVVVRSSKTFDDSDVDTSLHL
ncbi:hypothetical protein GIB67_011195 [Kingdonia uniflora]|uniref:Uncharacterized protein n=1 Tax=Kingdonia uniflora TaxID=39325 RepID=A0A7J7M402_9MAGN|nr:hypothetical protein GIB67_011195 [Kingdonia uniflora]